MILIYCIRRSHTVYIYVCMCVRMYTYVYIYYYTTLTWQRNCSKVSMYALAIITLGGSAYIVCFKDE